MRDGSRHLRYVLAAVVALILVVLATAGTAQVPIFRTPTPSPTREPAPTSTPPPSAAPTPEPKPTLQPTPSPSADPDESQEPSPSSSPGASPQATPNDDLPPELEQPALVVPNIPRTRARNTAKLVSLLEPLAEDLGLPLEQVLVEGMGRFPVAGVAYYRDDWMHPRYNPTPHLHKGLDIFADFGTPVRSPENGVVSRMTNNPAGGGVGAWVRGSGGTSYYYAHLLDYAPDLRVGQRVGVGTVIGFVGDSGNALGGAPHLHFEIHRGGAIPPKPQVDRWLDEAEELAPRWVQARREEIQAKRSLLGDAPPALGSRRADLEASMLLTLLDPVGGSVGMLPHLAIEPERGRLSTGLLQDLIHQRLDGYLFVPASSVHAGRD